MTVSLINAHITQGTDPDYIVSLADGYENPKMSETVLHNMINHATSQHHGTKTQELLETLQSEVETREGLSEASRKRMLERLKRK